MPWMVEASGANHLGVWTESERLRTLLCRHHPEWRKEPTKRPLMVDRDEPFCREPLGVGLRKREVDDRNATTGPKDARDLRDGSTTVLVARDVVNRKIADNDIERL